MRVSALLVLALLGVGCEAKRVEPAPTVAPTAKTTADATQASAGQSSEERRLGAPVSTEGETLAVAQVLSAPEPYLGKTVKCEGTVARVCQAAGCWLELQAEAGGEGLRVPMAAHAFFIPQDAVGHVAIVEGQLKRRDLPETQRKHYEGEGMKAVGPLSLEATGVVLR